MSDVASSSWGASLRFLDGELADVTPPDGAADAAADAAAVAAAAAAATSALHGVRHWDTLTFRTDPVAAVSPPPADLARVGTEACATPLEAVEAAVLADAQASAEIDVTRSVAPAKDLDAMADNEATGRIPDSVEAAPAGARAAGSAAMARRARYV